MREHGHESHMQAIACVRMCCLIYQSRISIRSEALRHVSLGHSLCRLVLLAHLHARSPG